MLRGPNARASVRAETRVKTAAVSHLAPNARPLFQLRQLEPSQPAATFTFLVGGEYPLDDLLLLLLAPR